MTSTSFHLTPELKARAVELAFHANGKFEHFVDSTKLIEKEPSRGKCFIIPPGIIYLTPPSF